ncbi:MAG: 30S ribosomal protein S15 [Runella slithyformis]|jgi:small subunit ribosomal protein S15|nr:MAG: 30S ribosomal protein S15 [Runella slithyformis]TAF97113.1 MAG: 30S ribosomal protein S15 [Runella sp.]TAG21595.1 MAG: 30S ribosomal protein S15 [Cytophagales bacterium]TAG40858.1 MAG: 30S ribosomal protein S15 [Cytophagia bacterium]TAF01136.1 MAG: 30S ribosomal protein S15 [Runella slithyformis]
MYLTPEVKKDLFKKHGHSKSESDTGSPEAQIALFTFRINHLTDHLKKHKHDSASRLGLLKLVGKRRRLLDYLQKVEIGRYRAIIAELNIRK